MRAIVILFPNEFKSKAHKKDAIGSIASVISETTDSTDIKIHEFDDVSVAKILVSETSKEVKTSDNISNLINNFCYSIICKVGDPNKFSEQKAFKREFLKRFLNDAEIREKNTEAIKYLISSGKLTPAHKKILEGNHLLCIPDYLKEISNIINIF